MACYEKKEEEGACTPSVVPEAEAGEEVTR